MSKPTYTPATIASCRESKIFLTGSCDHCGFFRGLGRSDFSRLSDNTPVPSIGQHLTCDRCNRRGLHVNGSHTPSANPYPGKMFYISTPWINNAIESYEPGSEAYRRQLALLKERGRL